MTDNFVPEPESTVTVEARPGPLHSARKFIVDDWPTEVLAMAVEIEVTEAFLGELVDTILARKKR